MYRSPGKSGWHEIDGVRVHTDSLMEAAFIRSLVKNGFQGKWRRTRYGQMRGKYAYTPDVELSVLQNGKNIRALVEFKPQRMSEFAKAARKRMAINSGYYKDTVLLLYVEKTKRWYHISKQTYEAERCEPPIPGTIHINELPRPRGIPILHKNGRFYTTTVASLILHLLETLFVPRKRNRRRRKR